MTAIAGATWGENARVGRARRSRDRFRPDTRLLVLEPAGFQYGAAALASLTKALLDQTDVSRLTLVAHSAGGIIAMRYALLYPDRVSSLVLVNPLGLNDTFA